jgi:hypothetical protein
MGLGKRVKATYAYVKEGKLVTKTKEGEKTIEHPFDYVEGRIVGLQIQEERFQEDVYDELQIRIQDNDGITVVVVRAGSWFGINFFQRIVNVDLAKEVRLGVYSSKSDDAGPDVKPTNFCYIFQGGSKIEPNRDVVPKPEKVVVDRKNITSFGKCVEAMKKIVLEVEAKISKWQIGSTVNAAPGGASPAAKDDDLPF